jgi:hypothetical protein
VKYRLDIVGVQDVKWDKSGNEQADDYTFLYGNGNEKHLLRTGVVIHKGIISAFRRVEFVSDN